MNKKLIVIIASAALVAAFVLGISLYKAQRAQSLDFLSQENVSTFVRPHSHKIGPEDAKVYLVEFMDPACETCRVFSSHVHNLMAENAGKIRLIIRYAPFHQGSDTMVKILEAAGKQGKYWETLDVMFRSQRYWASHHRPQLQKIWQFLPEVGLDIEKIKKDMNDPAIARLIEQDLADSKTLNVRKTPGFFVNGKPLQTFGYRQLQQLVLSEIRAIYPD